MYEMTVEKQRQTWYNKILSTTASVKTGSVLVSDITNNIVCRRISAIICTYMIYLKCQRFLYARQVAMLREKDLLTRLLNRNSYENKIKVYARRPHQGLICIYADMATDCMNSTTRWDMKPEPVY